MSEEGQAKQESMPPAGEIQESTQAGEEAVLAVTQGETRQTPEVQQNPETRPDPGSSAGPGDSGGPGYPGGSGNPGGSRTGGRNSERSGSGRSCLERRTVYRSV